jgi:N-acetyl-gamma-glutamyl-phosphate reductase
MRSLHTYASMDRTTTAAVLGASGFTGGELVRLLHGHPGVELTYLGGAGSVGQTLAEVHPHLSGLPVGSMRIHAIEPQPVAAAASLVFSALPNGSSAGLLPALVEAGPRAIDLAGDFRLPAGDYPEWYGFEHPSPDWLDRAVYGVPELFAKEIVDARLVANPGCYATAMILGCAPILEAGLAEPGPIRVDGKTGLSGAGRKTSESTSFASTEDAIRPYRFPAHQHTPEMERGIARATGLEVAVLFVPHLVPAVRGVVTTCYLPLASGVTTEALTACLAEAYDDRPFVRVLPPGAMVDAKRTRGSNVLELQAVADPRTGTAVVVGAIDNLVKGAAGQAIQNANLLLGLPEATGLPVAGVWP